MPQKRMECFRLLLNQPAWIEHQFLSGIRDSMKTGSLWGMIRGVGGVRKADLHSWLAQGLGLGLLCWGFKGVQREIPWEEASTLEIGSVGFPAGQWPSLTTSPYHSSPLAGLRGYIPYHHIAAVWMFELVVLFLIGHMRGSTGVHHLRSRPCFSSSVRHVWFL